MSTKFWRSISILATPFALVLLIAPAWTVAQSIQDDAVITVTINGHQHNVKPGDKVLLLDDRALSADEERKLCYVDDMTFSVKSAPAMQYARAIIRVTDQCELQVERSDTLSAPPSRGDSEQAVPTQSLPEDGSNDATTAEPSPAAVTTYNGWATAEYHEQFGIIVTEAHATLTYDDDGSAVFNARNPNGWCWWRRETGWGNARCQRWHDLGHVWTHTDGDFTHKVPLYNHTMGVTFEAHPGGVTKCIGNFSGWVPKLWGYSCASGR